MHNNYIFFLNIRDINVTLPHEVVPGYTLTKANASQNKEISSRLKLIAPRPEGQDLPHEEERIKRQGAGFRYKRLSEDELTYYIVLMGKGEDRGLFCKAAMLATPEWIEGFIASTHRPGAGRSYAYSRLIVHNYLSRLDINRGLFLTLNEVDIADVRTQYNKIKVHDHALLDIKSLISQYTELLGYDHASHLRLLGYFSIIENMITHAPEPKDPYDSIGRQIRSKIALLNNRFSEQIDYQHYFGSEANPKTIWKRLYEYRSSIAHGSEANFNGNLKLLKNRTNAREFVISVVKQLLRHALDEPELIRDIKQC